MKVRIAVAESSRVVELDVDDGSDFEQVIESAFAGDSALVWVDDTKQRRVGIPRDRIAYVEIEAEEGKPSVGFAPAG